MFEAILKFLSGIMFFVLHGTGAGAFPKALSAEEETRLLELYKKGDQNARSKLIEHNLRLVAHVVKKYYSAGADNDDLISIGTIGLIKAVSSYDSDKGIRLATYASRCIENATLSQMSFWLRKELPIGELPSRQKTVCKGPRCGC